MQLRTSLQVHWTSRGRARCVPTLTSNSPPLETPQHRSTLKDYVARATPLGIKNFIAGICRARAPVLRWSLRFPYSDARLFPGIGGRSFPARDAWYFLPRSGAKKLRCGLVSPVL